MVYDDAFGTFYGSFVGKEYGGGWFEEEEGFLGANIVELGNMVANSLATIQESMGLEAHA